MKAACLVYKWILGGFFMVPSGVLGATVGGVSVGLLLWLLSRAVPIHIHVGEITAFSIKWLSPVGFVVVIIGTWISGKFHFDDEYLLEGKEPWYQGWNRSFWSMIKAFGGGALIVLICGGSYWFLGKSVLFVVSVDIPDSPGPKENPILLKWLFLFGGIAGLAALIWEVRLLIGIAMASLVALAGWMVGISLMLWGLCWYTDDMENFSLSYYTSQGELVKYMKITMVGSLGVGWFLGLLYPLLGPMEKDDAEKQQGRTQGPAGLSEKPG